MDNGIHPSDPELFRALTAQLPPSSLRAIAAHLAGCQECRARMYRVERRRQEADECAIAAAVPAPSLPASGRMASIAAASSLLALSAMAYWAVATGPATSLQAASLPNPALTPGAAGTVDAHRLCSRPLHDDRMPSVQPALAQAVFQNYRIGRPTPGAYEVDYLITPDLGGTDDVRNLWPQPYDDGTWNARVKDALEDRLRELVCAGKLDLQTAQKELATDWIAAYRKYFGSREPLPAHRRFVKDQPWHE